MSAWQRSQALDCMKYSDGMYLPSVVCAELGKNLPCGPSPSPSMVAGGICGLVTRFAWVQEISRSHQAPKATPEASSTTVAKRRPAPLGPSPSQFREASHETARENAPKTQSIICAYSQ